MFLKCYIILLLMVLKIYKLYLHYQPKAVHILSSFVCWYVFSDFFCTSTLCLTAQIIYIWAIICGWFPPHLHLKLLFQTFGVQRCVIVSHCGTVFDSLPNSLRRDCLNESFLYQVFTATYRFSNAHLPTSATLTAADIQAVQQRDDRITEMLHPHRQPPLSFYVKLALIMTNSDDDDYDEGKSIKHIHTYKDYPQINSVCVFAG